MADLPEPFAWMVEAGILSESDALEAKAACDDLVRRHHDGEITFDEMRRRTLEHAQRLYQRRGKT